MQIIRRIVFALFVAIYVVTCPMVIMRSLGYAYHPGPGQELVRTGLISVASIPQGATVYLNNRRYAKRTPTTIPDLLPGTYTVKLVLKDHQPWSDTVAVAVKKATVLEKIVLLPAVFTRTMLSRAAHEALWPVPDTRWMVLPRGTRLADVAVYDGREERLRPLASEASAFGTHRLAGVTVMRDSPIILLRTITDGHPAYLLADLRTDPVHLEEITAIVPEPLDDVVWDPLDRKRLFAVSRASLYRIDLGPKPTRTPLRAGVAGLGCFEKLLYALTDEGILRLDHDGKSAGSLFGEAAPIRLLERLRQNERFQITVFAKEAVVLSGAQGEILTGRPLRRFVDHGIIGLAWAEPRALVWHAHALGVLDFSAAMENAEDRWDAPELQWWHTQGKRIQQAFWVLGGSHVLFRDGDRVMLLERAPEGASRLADICRVKPETSIAYSEEQGSLFYLEPATGALVRLRLLPHKELLPLSKR
ncbi:MAG: PEGA domain-containing protein [Candidatus Omnitrophica bacterium]|nr:PEGA domain-containing protein [Candidatus Omnitrophota bacterium]